MSVLPAAVVQVELYDQLVLAEFNAWTEGFQQTADDTLSACWQAVSTVLQAHNASESCGD